MVSKFRRVTVVLGTAAMAAGTLVALAPSTVAAPAVPAEMFSAMQRDLDLSADEARARLAGEATAATIDRSIRKRVGDRRFGGSWYDAESNKLVVAVTDSAAARSATANGAEAKVVARSEDTLDALKAKLDANKAASPSTVTGWFVDVTTNTVTVVSKPHAVGAAKAFARRSGVPADAVRVEASTESPRPLIDVVGGNAYYIGSGSRCSVGFSVNGGFVTAGHCGSTGASTSQPSGSFAGSSFPGNDYGWVRVNSGNTMIGAVNNYSGGRVSVAGSSEAPVGSSVCRSGSTTGWHCGTIQARNSSVTYPQGTVSGLIRTTVCAEPGDSGGSLLAGNQAQGVTSGGSGNCRSGGTTYFQPVNEILSRYGLTLITSGGNPPPPPPGDCDGHDSTYTGSLSSGGAVAEPNGSYYYSSRSGTHSGCLDGPSGADFDLYLQKWTGSSWSSVASGTTPDDDETVSYNGSSGYYRWVVHAYSGSGSYQLGASRP